MTIEDLPDNSTTTQAKTNLKLQARGAAVARLIEDYEDDFHAYMAEEYKERGLVYDRPLTEEEKAHKEILDLIAKHGPGIIPKPAEVSAVLATEPDDSDAIEA